MTLEISAFTDSIALILYRAAELSPDPAIAETLEDFAIGLPVSREDAERVVCWLVAAYRAAPEGSDDSLTLFHALDVLGLMLPASDVLGLAAAAGLSVNAARTVLRAGGSPLVEIF